MNKRLYNRNDLSRRGITISNTTLLRRERAGLFPARRYLTPRTVVWCADSVEAYLAALISEKDEGADNA